MQYLSKSRQFNQYGEHKSSGFVKIVQVNMDNISFSLGTFRDNQRRGEEEEQSFSSDGYWYCVRQKQEEDLMGGAGFPAVHV